MSVLVLIILTVLAPVVRNKQPVIAKKRRVSASKVVIGHSPRASASKPAADDCKLFLFTNLLIIEYMSGLHAATPPSISPSGGVSERGYDPSSTKGRHNVISDGEIADLSKAGKITIFLCHSRVHVHIHICR